MRVLHIYNLKSVYEFRFRKAMFEMKKRVHEINLGISGGKRIILLSKVLYRSVVLNGGGTLYYPPEYDNKFESLKNKTENYKDVTEFVTYIKKNILNGIFVLKNGEEFIAGCSYLDSSLKWYETGDRIILSDSAVEIAKKENLELFSDSVASYLITGLPVYPFETVSFWREIIQISPFDILKITLGKASAEMFYTQVELNRNVEPVIEGIRKKLIDNLCDIKKSYNSFSCDVSGGVDSACIVYMMNKITDNLMLFHSESDENANSDTKWAGYIARDLKIKLNKLQSVGKSGKRFSVEDDFLYGNVPDAPLLWGDTEGYVSEMLKSLPEYNKHIHMIGIGGDELYTAMPANEWSIIRQEGIKSIPFALKYSILMRRPFFSCMKDLYSKTDYQDELHEAVDFAFGKRKSGSKREQRWSDNPDVPKWITSEYMNKCYEMIKKEIDTRCMKICNDKMQFQSVQSVIFQKNVFSQINQIASDKIAWYAPFLDAQVIEDSLSIPARYRTEASTTKPTLYKALKGIVPEEVFKRGVKGDYSDALYEGYREAASKYCKEIKDFELARMGIINAEMLSTELSMPSAVHNRVDEFMRVCNAERWIRQVKNYIERVEVDYVII